MNKRRSSISGRGAEILLGEPPPIRIEPRNPSPVPAQEEASEQLLDLDLLTQVAEIDPLVSPEPVWNEAELQALFEEARAGEPEPEGEKDDQLADGVVLPLVLEEEPPKARGSIREVPSQAIAPKSPGSYEEVAMHEPPPAEGGDGISDILPPKPARRFAKVGEFAFSDAGVQEPEGAEGLVGWLEQELTQEDRQKIVAQLGGVRLQELETRIAEVYEEVRRQVGVSEEIATECYNKLFRARDILMRRDLAEIAQAEYNIEQVRARLKRAAESEVAAKKFAWPIMLWGLIWFSAFATVLALFNVTWFREMIRPVIASNSPVGMEILIPAMIWGGLGGVACIFYSLFKHVGRRDFDRQYTLSYLGKPFLGIILGATVYMVINLLVLLLGILPARLQSGSESVTSPAVAPWIIYLLAWTSGFKENRIFDLVDRVMKRVFQGEDVTSSVRVGGSTGPTG
ncbi:MAG: hypothetical protein ACUVWZ_08160 [Anaerolineae bacterium]